MDLTMFSGGWGERDSQKLSLSLSLSVSRAHTYTHTLMHATVHTQSESARLPLSLAPSEQTNLSWYKLIPRLYTLYTYYRICKVRYKLQFRCMLTAALVEAYWKQFWKVRQSTSWEKKQKKTKKNCHHREPAINKNIHCNVHSHRQGGHSTRS